MLRDGTIIDVHSLQPSEWAGVCGVQWLSGDKKSNYTRFLNHAGGTHANCAVAADSKRFGRSHAIYTKKPIRAGEELFFNYGRDYWEAVGIVPDPPVDNQRAE